MSGMMSNQWLVTFLLGVMLCVSNARAWGPIAHYIITKEALGTSGSEVAPYSNLPDAWSSQEGILAWLDTGVYFRWSHGVIDHGHYNVYLGFAWIPKKPTFPDDGRYPGQVMKELIEHKLDNTTGKWETSKNSALSRKVSVRIMQQTGKSTGAFS